MLTIDSYARSEIYNLLGKLCCRQRLGRGRSLSIGFGGKVHHDRKNLVDDYYGEWEVGTYNAAWRVVDGDVILCGSQEVVDTLSELEERFRCIKLGRIDSISMNSKFDIWIVFEDGKRVEILGLASDDDEIFHIFSPNGLYVTYSILDGWKVAPVAVETRVK